MSLTASTMESRRWSSFGEEEDFFGKCLAAAIIEARRAKSACSLELESSVRQRPSRITVGGSLTCP
eukprot:scaffold132273_cov37-Tisochrysis_lutea.AAC.2